jgi:hypothetical protein
MVSIHVQWCIVYEIINGNHGLVAFPAHRALSHPLDCTPRFDSYAVILYALLLSIVCSCHEPYINYCNLVWTSQHKRENLEKILKIQKRFCRIITFSTFHAHSQPLFKQLALMTVYDISAGYVYVQLCE